MTMQILYLEEIQGQSMIVNFGKKSVIEPVAQPSNWGKIGQLDSNRKPKNVFSI